MFVDSHNHMSRKQFDETFFRLLDRLDELCLKGTFFCLGSLAVDFPDVVREIAKRGHEVGCHSHNHVWLTKLSPVEFRKDTSDAISALEICEFGLNKPLG